MSPVLAALLKYLSDNYFSEEKIVLNEYRIGVEALWRPADFDPAKNSNVRVEMHRLRRRLQKFYETEGANHSLRVLLTEGRYGIQFVKHESEPVESFSQPEELGKVKGNPENGLDLEAPLMVAAAPGMMSIIKPKKVNLIQTKITRRAAAAIIVALLISASALIALRSREKPAPPESKRTSRIQDREIAIVPDGRSVRILAGNQNSGYVDRNGKVWVGDRYFTGGRSIGLKLPYIQGTPDPTVFQSAREGDFTYDIPLHGGKYELRLYFVETNFGPGTFSGSGDGSRLFSVALGTQNLLEDFDVLSEAGGNFRAFTRVFKDISPGQDGLIHLRFIRKVNQPFVNAIELIPEDNGRLNPVRIVMQDHPLVDHAGNAWSADNFAVGGRLTAHRIPITNANNQHLFDGERFGNFTYQIPVAAGRYSVKLYFTEAVFGGSQPASGVGARVFDVYANGEALLRKFDVFKRSRGKNKPLIETFNGIQPNSAGLITLSFVPDRNYACVSAIEVSDESR